MRTLLYNSFHKSYAALRLTPISEGRWANRNLYVVTKRQIGRAFAKLCGMHDCVCGDTFGQRTGEQYDGSRPHNHISIVDNDYEGNAIVTLDN